MKIPKEIIGKTLILLFITLSSWLLLWGELVSRIIMHANSLFFLPTPFSLLFFLGVVGIYMPKLVYLLLALRADPNPLGGSLQRRIQAVEMICFRTCATGLQVNATLACCAVFIMMDLILKEKERTDWVKSTH